MSIPLGQCPVFFFFCSKRVNQAVKDRPDRAIWWLIENQAFHPFILHFVLSAVSLWGFHVDNLEVLLPQQSFSQTCLTHSQLSARQIRFEAENNEQNITWLVIRKTSLGRGQQEQSTSCTSHSPHPLRGLANRRLTSFSLYLTTLKVRPTISVLSPTLATVCIKQKVLSPIVSLAIFK